MPQLVNNASYLQATNQNAWKSLFTKEIILKAYNHRPRLRWRIVMKMSDLEKYL